MKWISISECLPEFGELVLTTDGLEVEFMVCYGVYKGHPQWSAASYVTLDATAWAKIPGKPED